MTLAGSAGYHHDMSSSDLMRQFGQIDIYLFDQLLRGRIGPGDRVLDAGCGFGRNLVYLAGEGYDLCGADTDQAAVEAVRRIVPGGDFRVEPVEAMSFPDCCADVVLSSAVLHFARDDSHFDAMLCGTWRVLRPGGIFFCRLASSIGLENQARSLSGRRCALPDGSERYLVDEPMLMERTARLGGQLLDPLKTTVVQKQRAMSTWVLRKNGS